MPFGNGIPGDEASSVESCVNEKRSTGDLVFFSSAWFVISLLAVRAFVTVWTGLLLKISGISFEYRLFSIDFISEFSYSQFMLREITLADTRWTEEQIYLVFGSGPLIVSALGFRVLMGLRRRITAPWKTRLVLAWLSFVMVNTLPAALLTGVFVYDGFGTAFQWMVPGWFLRGALGLGVSLVLVASGRFWRRLFLNACHDPLYLADEYRQKEFIQRVFLRSWLWGALALIPFSLATLSPYWVVFSLALGIVPGVNQTLRHQTIVIADPETPVFASRAGRMWLGGMILGLFALSWIAFRV